MLRVEKSRVEFRVEKSPGHRLGFESGQLGVLIVNILSTLREYLIIRSDVPT